MRITLLASPYLVPLSSLPLAKASRDNAALAAAWAACAATFTTFCKACAVLEELFQKQLGKPPQRPRIGTNATRAAPSSQPSFPNGRSCLKHVADRHWKHRHEYQEKKPFENQTWACFLLSWKESRFLVHQKACLKRPGAKSSRCSVPSLDPLRGGSSLSSLTELFLDWTIPWLIHSLTEPFLDWTIPWLSYSLIDLLTYSSTELFLDWTIPWLIYSLTGLFPGWSTPSLTYSSTELFLDWTIPWLIYSLTGLFPGWSTPSLTYSSTELFLDWTIPWLIYSLTGLFLDC